MRPKIAYVANVRNLFVAAELLVEHSGIAIVHGPSGFGKTTAIVSLANADHTDAAYIRMREFMSPLAMFQSVGAELGLKRHARIAPMMDAIVAALRKTGRALFIDEADRLLVAPRLIEGLRDLHDEAGTPVVLIGMAGFRRAALAKPQLAGRLAADVEFKPLTIEDARLTAVVCCEIEIEEGAIVAMHDASAGEIRRLVVQLARAEHHARRRGLDKITGAEWRKIAPATPKPARALRAV